MTTNSIRLTWHNKLAFEVEQDGHQYFVDGDTKFGGEDKGVRPKALLLAALAGCSGMDTTSILQKMRIPEFKLIIDVEGEVEEDFPKAYTKIEIFFRFEGEDLPVDKLKRAVELSLEKYCAVYSMLKRIVPIEDKIFLNGEEV